jgi:chaperonin GroEL (HSP60 family)
MWRSWLTETERQLNSFFGEALGTEQFARASGNFVDGYAVVQRSLNQGMERYLNTFNLPTHSDVVELGERLHAIEDRITSLEGAIRTLADKSGVDTASNVTKLRPKRTRKPVPKDGRNSGA